MVHQTPIGSNGPVLFFVLFSFVLFLFVCLFFVFCFVFVFVLFCFCFCLSVFLFVCLFFKTGRVCHFWCTFQPNYTGRTSVMFGKLKDGRLQFNNLASNNRFC